MTLSQQQGALSNFVANWNESNTGATGVAATVTHAAESGLSHYVCGCVVGVSDYASANPDSVVITLQDDSSDIIVFPVTSSGTDDYDPTGQPVVINFANPLKITSGNSVTIKTGSIGSYSTAYVNLWGFTDL